MVQDFIQDIKRIIINNSLLFIVIDFLVCYNLYVIIGVKVNDIDNEKAILNEEPDYDRQLEILKEDHLLEIKKRKWYVLMSGIFVSIVLIFLVSYSMLYAYIPYGLREQNPSKNVDIHVDDDNSGGKIKEDKNKKPNINVTDKNETGSDKKPAFNIDYLNNRKATFHIDVYGNKSKIFNPSSQMDSTNTYCVMNCDSNDDGWPDYNLDLNGDGTADINIVSDPKNSNVCDLNCDLNLDTIPDINVDINGDGIPDINIIDSSNKPIKNIDYMGNRIPVFNIENNGVIENKVNDATNGKSCSRNCDIDGDGWPDYNIVLPGSDAIINEKIKSNSYNVDYQRGKTVDWKCFKSASTSTNCTSGLVESNEYINIDVNGDGIPDINVSNDHGQTITNKINNKVTINGKNIILNEDTNKDGFPDINIDVDGDGKPDLNITDNYSNVCIKNCDTNFDGIEDYLIDIDGTGRNLITINNLNIDYDFDTVYEVNVDTNNDLYPDLNIDLDGDKVPDLNIDYNHDGIADFNIDTNHDGKADINLDPYSIGKCVFNCEENGIIKNIVNSGDACTTNCDTNNDGWPDQNVDINADGVCDINCGKIDDKNGDYYKDSEFSVIKVNFNENTSGNRDVTIVNGIDINAHITELQPESSWNKTYVLTITNDTDYAVDYYLIWKKVKNEFTSGNMRYYITQSSTDFISDRSLPNEDMRLTEKLIIKKKTTIKYVLNVYLYNQPYNQIEDAGKAFDGKLMIELEEK